MARLSCVEWLVLRRFDLTVYIAEINGKLITSTAAENEMDCVHNAQGLSRFFKDNMKIAVKPFIPEPKPVVLTPLGWNPADYDNDWEPGSPDSPRCKDGTCNCPMH